MKITYNKTKSHFLLETFMKKKLLTILLVIFSVSTCLFTLTACRHEHSYTTTYTWNDNLCKAARVCSKDSSHVDTEIAIGVS